MNIVPLPRKFQINENSCNLTKFNVEISCDIFSSLFDLTYEQLNAQKCNSIIFSYILDEKLLDEEYILEVKTTKIIISASTYNGAYHGLQSLRQLCLDYDNIVPCLTIKDSPTYSYRGFMLDCSRHFFPLSQIKKLIDIASMHHLNFFHWHLIDDQGWRLEIPSFPLLTQIGSKRDFPEYNDGRKYEGFYTADDVKELEGYASKRGITIIPEIETPGHASALLASYPEYGCTKGPYNVEYRYGIFDEVMCAGNDKLFDFLDKVISYMASIFKSPYIHIGGDECPTTRWKTCEKCQKRIKDENLKDETELQAYTITRIAKIVEKYNKRPIGWDEVLYGTENLGLPKSLIVMSWQGMKGGIEASKRGFNVIMCPNTEGCYFDYKARNDENESGNIGVNTLEDALNYNPIHPNMDHSAKEFVLGGQANLWTEWVVFPIQAEYMLFPRLSATAEVLWNKTTNTSFYKRKEALINRLHKLKVACNINC